MSNEKLKELSVLVEKAREKKISAETFDIIYYSLGGEYLSVLYVLGNA